MNHVVEDISMIDSDTTTDIEEPVDTESKQLSNHPEETIANEEGMSDSHPFETEPTESEDEVHEGQASEEAALANEEGMSDSHPFETEPTESEDEVHEGQASEEAALANEEGMSDSQPFETEPTESEDEVHEGQASEEAALANEEGMSDSQPFETEPTESEDESIIQEKSGTDTNIEESYTKDVVDELVTDTLEFEENEIINNSTTPKPRTPFLDKPRNNSINKQREITFETPLELVGNIFGIIVSDKDVSEKMIKLIEELENVPNIFMKLILETLKA